MSIIVRPAQSKTTVIQQKKQRPQRQRRVRNPTNKALPRQRRPRSQRRQKRSMSNAMVVAKLSACAREYAHALADPFDGPLGCIPDYPALNTRRARVFARGTGATGTNGIGFVATIPNNGIAGDDNFVYSSTSAYTLTAFPTTWTEAGVVASDSNSEYSTAQLVDGNVLVRTVAHGLRVRYTGTEYARGGEIYSLQHPAHQTLSNATPGNLAGFDEFKRFEVDREWKTVVYTPVDLADTSFGLYANIAPTALNGAFMGHMILAPSSTAETFSWEAFSVVEYNGPNVRGKTPSHYDPAGFAAVQAATALAQNLQPSTLPGPVRAIKHIASATKILNENASGIGSNVSSTISSMASIANTVSGAYNGARMIGNAGGVAQQLMGTASKIGGIQSGSSSAASSLLSIFEDGGEDLLKFLPFAALAL